jgi:DNA-directed RNA polymerase specialized sigma subunit
MLNNSKEIKDTSPMYQKSFIHAQQIWIEYKHLVKDIVKGGEEYKVNIRYKVISPYI